MSTNSYVLHVISMAVSMAPNHTANCNINELTTAVRQCGSGVPLTKHLCNNVEGIIYPVVCVRHRRGMRNA